MRRNRIALGGSFVAAGTALLAASTAWSEDDGTGNVVCESSPDSIPACIVPEDALLPDLFTVVPKHLQIQNTQQTETLRFSNGIANLGRGPWWLEPDFPDAGSGETCQAAYQVITGPEHFEGREIIPTDEQVPAPDGTFELRCQKGNFDFHETHNHWHIDNVGEFKVCVADDFDVFGRDCEPAATTGGEPTVGIKFTFCLIDWYRLGTNSPSSDPTRNFFSCETGFQGVSPGWVDQYHQATDGQEIDITGLPAGDYVLVSTVNVGALDGAPVFEEEDPTNNTSWVRFALRRASNGNAQLVQEVGACDDDAEYLAEVEAEVDEYIAYYPEDAAFRDDLVDDLCGGKPANR